MKAVMIAASTGRKLGLITSIMAMLSGFSASAANYLIVNETYDPPPLTTPGGWENGVIDLSRKYVSQGVGGSTALQISATLVDPDASVASALFQSGVMGGNEWATRDNTVLSFDLKIDSPGLSYVSIHLDAFAEYVWNYGDFPNATYSGAVAEIALGSYQPGVFQKIVIPLNDPRWLQIYPWPDTGHLAPLFDPSARTYNNVTLIVDSGSLPDLGQFMVTIDNVQISTKNAMIPFRGTGAGEVTLGQNGYVVTERGIAEHIGSFKGTYVLPYDGSPGSAELTAANGDKLLGSSVIGGNDVGIEFEEGTGRFDGFVGSYRGAITWDPTYLSYTTVITGGISTVGWNKNQ